MKRCATGSWRAAVSLFSAVAAAACVVRASTPPPPPPVVVAPPPRHPAYLHALSNLRAARAHLERPKVVTVQGAWDEAAAVREIDGAIQDLRQASIDDGKPLADHPPIDVHLDWAGRLHATEALLAQARGDVAQEEDNAFAQGLRDRSIRRIDAAMGLVRQGMAAAPPPVVYAQPQPQPPRPLPAQHPAYIQALETLRLARAHLQRPQVATARTVWDEQAAVREIDQAIWEIRQASIDDGKDLNAHPPVGAVLDWRGRLHQTIDLLTRARGECMREEDNAFARGLQARAVGHIDRAVAFVRQGIVANRY